MKTLITLLILISFTACSIFQPSKEEEREVTNETKTEEVYVFDDVNESEQTDSKKEIKELETELDKTLNKKEDKTPEVVDVFAEDNTDIKTSENVTEQNNFYLQLGAFSTLKRAEQFTEENISLVPFQLSIIFNTNTSLYTVRSSPYSTKDEVYTLREDLRNKGLFKDSFIISE